MENSVKDLRQFKKRVLTFSDVGVTAGAKKTGNIPTTKTIHDLVFICKSSGGTGLTRSQFIADIASVVVRAGGTVIRELTVTQILDMYKHYQDDKVAFTPEGILPIQFASNAFDLSQLNNDHAIGMILNGKPMNLTYEIIYKATVTTCASVEVRAIVDDRVQDFGRHTRIRPHTRSFSSTGIQDIADMPVGGADSVLLAYHFVLGSGVIKEITVSESQREVYNQVPRELMDYMLNNAGRKAQSGYFHLPFNLDNDPRSVQVLGPNTSNWLIQPNWSTTPDGSYTILEEALHTQL